MASEETGGSSKEVETVQAPSPSTPPRLSKVQLRKAPVLTICGININCSLQDFIPLGNMVEAGLLVRDRMDTVNLAFRDEATRKKAFRILEGEPAREILDDYSQYSNYYVAWRPPAETAFFHLEPMDGSVFDHRRRIYLKDEFKPEGYENGPTETAAVSTTICSRTEEESTSGRIKPVSAFLTNTQPPPKVCPACRRFYTFVPA
ncbi:uncharacterized protein JCM6883_003214 [Sporobolomyces salmoneus]|uniref:uncharacterized protein n=1 Tax=Sporobolomyces salmoneus TaxID=183962 RepID=UPI0031806F49